LEWKGERRGEAKKLKKEGQTNIQTSKKTKTSKETKKFQRYKQGEIVY
jgi:hypothetical protein